MLDFRGIVLASGSPTPPDWCFQPNAQGQIPICIQNSDGTWSQSFPGTAFPMAATSLLPVLVVLAIAAGAALLVWKVTKARNLARSAGMSQGDATAMTLLTEDGLAATYLASNLRGKSTPPEAAQPSRTSAERLTELRQLLDSGLITTDEYETRRRSILDEI